MDRIVPRWEWRAFGADFGLASARFARLQPEAEHQSDELYLLAPALDKTVKIRAGLLDVKSLERVNPAGLEQWRPALKAEFPLPHADVERLLAMLRLACLDAGGGDFTLEEFVEELRRCDDARTLPLHKLRRHFTIAGCMAELTDVTLADGQGARTVAVESEDAERVGAAIEYLGLSGIANTSYPRWLAAKVGLVV